MKYIKLPIPKYDKRNAHTVEAAPKRTAPGSSILPESVQGSLGVFMKKELVKESLGDKYGSRRVITA